MMDISYLYTTLYALEIIMYYENRRSIKISDLIEYRERVLDYIIEDYNEKEDHYTQVEDEIYGDLFLYC